MRMTRTWMKRKILIMMILINEVERDHQTELERYVRLSPPAVLS